MSQYCPKPWLDAPIKPFLGNLTEVAALPAGNTVETWYYGKKLQPIANSSLVAVLNDRKGYNDLILVDQLSGRRWHLVLPA